MRRVELLSRCFLALFEVAYTCSLRLGSVVCVHGCPTLLNWVYLLCYQFCYHVSIASCNRWAPNLQSPLAHVPLDALFSAEEHDTFVGGELSVPHPRLGPQPGPQNAQWKIPPSEWAEVMRCVERGETYRQIASRYNVSYESVRRVTRAARRENG